MNAIKLLGFLLISGFFLMACKLIKPEIPAMENNQALYRGKSFNVDVFVRIGNDTVILDWFYEEKIPRFSFTDTLYPGRSANNKWESDSSKIYIKRNRIVLETKSPYIPPQPLICRLHPSDKEVWEQEWNILKNVYLVRKEYLLFTSDTTFNSSPWALWNQMFNESKLQSQMAELNHMDFKVVFMNFKSEIIREARRVDPR